MKRISIFSRSAFGLKWNQNFRNLKTKSRYGVANIKWKESRVAVGKVFSNSSISPSLNDKMRTHGVLSTLFGSRKGTKPFFLFCRFEKYLLYYYYAALYEWIYLDTPFTQSIDTRIHFNTKVPKFRKVLFRVCSANWN